MNFEQYKAIDAVNWSTLKAMRVSPRHYQQSISHDIDESRQLRIGQALHTLILEPDEFELRHPTFAGKSRRGKAWDEYRAMLPSDAVPLTGSEADDVRNMADRVQSSDVALRHLQAGVSEKTIVWDDAETGIKCKARCDSVNGHLVELKSCNSLSFPHDRFESHAVRMGYHGQVAHYGLGLEAEGYDTDHGPAMIVVESAPPFDVAVYILKEDWIEAGRALRSKLLRELAECRKTQNWHGVMNGKELHLGLPSWAEWETLEATEPVTIGGVAIGGTQ